MTFICAKCGGTQEYKFPCPLCIPKEAIKNSPSFIKLQIIGVAVKQGDLIICLPRPNRHCHCIHYGVEALGLKPPIGAPALNQGFYLEDGTYLNREEAFEHVQHNGQKLKSKPNVYLFSEELW